MSEQAAASSTPAASVNASTGVVQSTKQRKPWLDILLYGLTLMVFIIIGILIGSTLLNVDIPFLSRPQTILKTQPEENGMFLMQEDQYQKVEMFQGVVPDDPTGILVTTDTTPSIVMALPWVNIDTLKLQDEKDNPVTFNVTPAENNISIIDPVEELSPGRYCLVYLINSTQSQNLYWCLIISEN